MDEIFNPSLIISLGPSSQKALETSKKLLDSLPKHFLDLIEYYDIENLDMLSKEIQYLIDTKLLAAKYLNKLVDMGYKVRSENISRVKINLYFFWDVYNSSLSAYEVIKLLSELSFGNVDKEQYSGAAIFVIPIMEKEWLTDRKDNIRAIEELHQVIDFVSKEENIINIDSRIYMLHCISNDGTRIPKEELQYIGGLLIYLNVLPSKNPPLSSFNKRLLMHEAAYKVGTIGITSITVFKDRLLREFSSYLACDLLKHAASYENDMDYSHYRIFTSIQHDLARSTLSEGVDCKLSDHEKYDIKLPREAVLYPKAFKEWEDYLESKALPEIKRDINNNAEDYANELTADIDKDISFIASKYSLKEGINYIRQLKESIAGERAKKKPPMHILTTDYNKELQKKVDEYPSIIGYTIKAMILACFLFYSLLPLANILFIVLFFTVYFIVIYLEYIYKLKKLRAFVNKYRKQVFLKNISLADAHIEETLFISYKLISEYLSRKEEKLKRCIGRSDQLSKSIQPVLKEEGDMLGNLITDLLNFEDRHKFYLEKVPDMDTLYSSFSGTLKGFDEFCEDGFKEKLISFSAASSETYLDLDFYDFMIFKYGDKLNEELSKWIDRGIVKSQYLLQYLRKDTLEEHSLFITSPEVNNASKELLTEKLKGFQVLTIEGEDIYTNCISIIRLCMGIELQSITPIARLKRGEENA